MPLDTLNLKNSNTHEQTTDAAGMLSSAFGIHKKSNSGIVDIK